MLLSLMHEMKLINKIGERSKEIRKDLGLSQMELAEIIETKQAQVSNFEAGLPGRISLESFLLLIEFYSQEKYNVYEIFNQEFDIKRDK